MPYIGKEPTTGNFIYADDITTSATNTYNILVGGVAFSPESANHLIVSLNGVIQKANTSFSVSGSQITFLPSSGTLSSSDSIDFILILGTVNAVGVATTVSDSAITKNKLNLISDSSSAGLTVKGDGSSENGTIALNCSSNSHAVKLSSPSHASGQSYEMILPATNITAGKVLKVESVSGSGATGIGQLSFGDAGGITMADQWRLQTSQSISADTQTTLTAWQQPTDATFGYIGSAMSQSSGIFTFPSTGIYFVMFTGEFQRTGDTRYVQGHIQVSSNSGGAYDTVAKNTSNIKQTSSATFASITSSFYVDVTNASDFRIRFQVGADETFSAVGSDSDTMNRTHVNFIRLGDT